MVSYDAQEDDENMPSAPSEQQEPDEPQPVRPRRRLEDCQTKFNRQIDSIGHKRLHSNSPYYYFTDIEIPFLEVIYDNVPAIARIFMCNTIINGGIAFTYLMLYVAKSIDPTKDGLFVDERSKGYHVTEENDYITIWLLTNIVLSMFDMMLTMLFMIRLSYDNYFRFVVCLYVVKVITWISSLWGTAII